MIPRALLLRCRRGLVSIEFAMLLPIMLALLCGTIEMTTLYAADRRVVAAAQACADLVAQEKSVDIAKLDDITRAVELTLEPLPTESLAFRITSVVFDAITGAPSVGWQRIVGAFDAGGHAAPTASAAGLGLAGESVIIVDISYGYVPVFTHILPASFGISDLAAARPRRVRVIPCSGC